MLYYLLFFFCSSPGKPVAKHDETDERTKTDELSGQGFEIMEMPTHFRYAPDHLLRLTNGFGYPMHPGVNRWTLLTNDLCRQAIDRQRLVLKTTGTQYRDFITLHDVARALSHFLFAVPEDWQDGLFNLGGNRSITIFEMAKHVARIYSRCAGVSEIPIETRSTTNNGAAEKKFEVSISKLLSTGFHLKGCLEDEIRNTFEICRGRIFE